MFYIKHDGSTTTKSHMSADDIRDILNSNSELKLLSDDESYVLKRASSDYKILFWAIDNNAISKGPIIASTNLDGEFIDKF